MSRLKKSQIKYDQRSENQSNEIQFVQLIESDDYNIKLIAEGLRVIEEACVGKLFLVGFQGTPTSISESIFNSHKIKRKNDFKEGVWISSIPRYNKLINANYLYLQTHVSNNSTLIKTHLILSLICSALVVCVHSSKNNLQYLTSINSRVVYNSTQQECITQLSALNMILQTDVPNEFTEQPQQLENILKIENIEQCRNIYPQLHYFLMGRKSKTQDLEVILMDQCCLNIKFFSQLAYGPVLSQYLQNICKAINKKGMVQIQKCKDDIQIDEAFQAYIKSISRYHQVSMQTFNQEGVFNVYQFFKNHRQQAIDHYNQLSTDARYLIKLNQYIDEKQQLILIENNRLCDQKSLNILKQQSNRFLHDVNLNNQRFTLNEANKEIEKIVQKYNHIAGGEHKQKILAEFLTAFTPEVYKVVDKSELKNSKIQIQQIQNQNNKLKSKMNEYKKDKEKKNQCCQIM